MTSLPKVFKQFVQAITPTPSAKRFKDITDKASEAEPSSEAPVVKRSVPIWQITVPLCVVFMFGIGARTFASTGQGRYLFDLVVSREQIKIRTDVDKRELSATDKEDVEGNSEKLEAPASVDRLGDVKVLK